ncbi:MULTISPECIES: nicotinate-nucleotide adenylyltransferase [Caldimonas]|jgi:nicotinate-nucleotide adenylyltransferase|uniref:nicotinate-nucleotide adenylyltransferase n=1 Tax=Caldimonas TaxID=196013 RepID=UPI00037E9059|nr:nicotinate-nucleotide adenylyltransferase [Caldimonas manganoxidans]MCX7660560.1 nicotinate-nucleotide adenylyltransferase [Caldimonas manganoxidans]
MEARRVGIFGGSFDPVHNAHVALARLALAHLALDRVVWIPAGQPWQKARRLAPAEHRLAMVRAAVADEPRFEVDDCEIRRAGPSYTLDTVKELRERWPGVQEWFLILGQDQYAALSTWHGWRELLQCVTLAVAGREGCEPAPHEALRSVPHRLHTLPLPPLPVSSTLVRQRRAAGLDIVALVPPAVASYIDCHRLYLTE